MKRKSVLFWEIILAVILLLIDRATKKWAVINLKDKDPIGIIDNVLELYYLPNGNTGAAFGMLKGHQGLFLLITIVVIAVIVFALIFLPVGNKYTYISLLLVFIAAGGLGNMIDRAFQGYVVDFIYISAINFPIFNVADIYVTVCTILLGISILKLKEDDYKEIESCLKAPFKKNSDTKDK